MLMTGKEYLQSIRDGRVIYVGKERISDQTTHPAFAGGARTYAALFDMKADPALRDVMTFEEGGERSFHATALGLSQPDRLVGIWAFAEGADGSLWIHGRTPARGAPRPG